MFKLNQNISILYLSAFLIKGWEVGLVLLLPFIQQHSGLTLFQIGLLTGCMSLFQIIFALFAGHISEKIGSKWVMITAILSYFVAWSIVSVNTSFIVLLPVYAFAGMASGIFMPIANASVAKLSTSRAISLGNFSAAADLGRVAISAITTLLIGMQSLILLSTTFALSSLLALFGLLKLHSNAPLSNAEKSSGVKMKDVIKNKKYLLCIIIGMADSFASASLFIFIPFLLLQKGVNIQTTSFLTGLFFLGYFSGRLILGRLSNRHGETKILALSELFMAGLIVAFIFVTNFLSIILILFLLGVFTRGTSPIIRAMVAHSVIDHTHFDKAYSFYSFSVNSSTVTSRALFGLIAGILGVSSVFYISGLIILLAIIPILFFDKLK